MACWYWILKLQARFLSGDYEVAIQAAQKAKALLWSSEAFIESSNYHFYHALTIAAWGSKVCEREQRRSRPSRTWASWTTR
jgi:hypothetical protein